MANTSNGGTSSDLGAIGTHEPEPVHERFTVIVLKMGQGKLGVDEDPVEVGRLMDESRANGRDYFLIECYVGSPFDPVPEKQMSLVAIDQVSHTGVLASKAEQAALVKAAGGQVLVPRGPIGDAFAPPGS